MPFGLRCATADFSRMYQKVLGPSEDEPEGLLGRICRVWVDDNVIYTGLVEGAAEHDTHRGALASILRRLVAHDMCIKPSKCIWATTRLPFLGHIVLAGAGLVPDPAKVQALIEAAPPICVSDLRTFIGASGWLSKHVEEYARLVAPLRTVCNMFDAKVKADISEVWQHQPEALAAFTALKVALCTPPVLVFPDFSKPFLILTDASGGEDGGYGCCLAQLDKDGKERPIAYHSAGLSKAQKHFGIMEAETAALMMALRKWRTYTQGNITIAITDHSAITSMLKPDKEFKSRKIQNWAVEMSEHDLIIAKRAGRVHFTADFLSRCKREKDRATLDNLYKLLWGRTAELMPHLKLNELFHLYSNEARLNRLAHEVQNAQLIQETDDGGKRVYTVPDMITAIGTGDRTLREQDLLIEDPDSRIGYFFDMITAVTPVAKVAAVTVDWILEEQVNDEFCQRMKQHLGKEVEAESDYEEEDEELEDEPEELEEEPAGAEEGAATVDKALQMKRRKAAAYEADRRLRMKVCSSAPYFALTADGLLVNLQHRRKGSDGEIAKELDMMQRIYIPAASTELQNEIIDALHAEAGHPKSLRTYQLLLQRVYWQGMFASVHERVSKCTKCQFHAARPAKAPLLGHQVATRCGEKIALDVVHLPKTARGNEYALTAVDVYSRYGFLVPLPDIKAATVLRAIRERILVLGLGKPDVYLLDGGSEFKAEVQAAIEAWDADAHVHAPLRKEAAGIIEIFNKTIEDRMAMLCEDTNTWDECFTEALDSYNGLVHQACSDGITAAISPAEVFLGRRMRFSVDSISKLEDDVWELPGKAAQRLRKMAVQVSRFIAEARAQYFMKQERQDPHSKTKLRVFNIGDEVTIHRPTGEKKLDKLSPLQDGPFEVVSQGTTGADYMVKRLGTAGKPRCVHVDQMRELKRVVPDAEAEELPEAKKYGKKFEVLAIVGEKGMTRRTKQFKVLWVGYKTTTWEPSANVDHCADRIKEWITLKPEEQHRLEEMTDEELVEEFEPEAAEEEAAAVSNDTIAVMIADPPIQILPDVPADPNRRLVGDTRALRIMLADCLPTCWLQLLSPGIPTAFEDVVTTVRDDLMETETQVIQQSGSARLAIRDKIMAQADIELEIALEHDETNWSLTNPWKSNTMTTEASKAMAVEIRLVLDATVVTYLSRSAAYLAQADGEVIAAVQEDTETLEEPLMPGGAQQRYEQRLLRKQRWADAGMIVASIQRQVEEQSGCDSEFQCIPCDTTDTTVKPKVKAVEATTEAKVNKQTSQQIPQPAGSPAEQTQELAAGQAVQMNLLPQLQMTGLISKVMAMAGYSMEQLRATVASPPCETFSLADASNISRGHFYRNHSMYTKPPRSRASCKTPEQVFKRQMAIDHDNLVKYLTESYMADKEEGYEYDFLMENPAASLRQRPYMRGERIEGWMQRKTVDYCAFGMPYKKSTDIWTSLKDWHPVGKTGNGKCNDGRCKQGWRKSSGRFNHRQRIGGPARLQPKGKNVKKLLWRLPQLLTHEFTEQLRQTQTSKEQKVVIDFFSGGESWKAAVEEAGYIYLPVDVRTLTTPTVTSSAETVSSVVHSQ